MARKHHYRRRSKELTELDVTTFLNLMVVLVPFLLITAVFSRLAVVELNLPSSAQSAVDEPPQFQLEVIVRASGLELTNGNAVIAALPKVDDEYDMERLADYVISLKQEYPDSNTASVLMEPEIAYDHLIQVMDVVRATDQPIAVAGGLSKASELDDERSNKDQAAQEPPQLIALFDQISVGSAP